MFLTTEPSLQGQRYNLLRVISGAGCQTTATYNEHAWNEAVKQALIDIEKQAEQLGADGIIGVQINTLVLNDECNAIAIGTAIKFQS
ncbi:MAG TPA: heavy metal-binding domain-containing protein [Ktedonobacterales bacterium]|nr:heavy metal-binding domain-containing protein [Ktedonobacterales bacterium]